MVSFKKKLHVSWHVAVASFGVVLGCAAAPALQLTSDISLLFIGIGMLLVVCSNRRVGFMILALIAGSLIGTWRGSSSYSELQVYKDLIGGQLSVAGKVAEDATIGQRGDQRIRLENTRSEGTTLPGSIWVSTIKPLDIKRGDIITASGLLGEGFGTINASMYRANIQRIERPNPGDIARQIRDTFADGVRVGIPEPQASLGVGYLVGQRSTLPEDLTEQLRTVGLTHAIVASGYNLTILVSLTRRVFARFSKYLAALSGTVLIWCFILITGFSPSMTRAGIVSGLGLLAWYYGRRSHPIVILSFAAAITVLLNPSYVWGDLGWFLSFASFAGILLMAPLLHHYFWGNKKPGIIRQLVLETTSAQLITMPIILFAFNQYSPYALLANVLALPLVPLAMLTTFIAGLTGLFAPVIAHIVSFPATILLSYTTSLVEKVAALPGAKSEISFSAVQVIISYVFLIIVLFYIWLKTKHNFRKDDNNL